MTPPTVLPLTIVGHRGARGVAPENTLLGLDSGIAAGCSWLEVDVQRHPSGELFLLHDLTLDATSNGSGLAAEMAWEDLRRLDAGQGQHIPTLTEAMTLCQGRVLLNLEIKTWHSTGEALARALAEIIDDGNWTPEQLLVSSFHWPELYEFKQRMPAVPVAPLFCGVPLDYAACAAELEARQIHISDEFADESLLADARARGLAVWAYTVNTPERAKALHRMGVSGIFTDYPARFTGGQ